MSSTHHYEVHGPGRDYDYTPFCEDCNDDAIECANEWLAEAFDGCDVGDDVAVTIKVVDGPLEQCMGDSCKLAAKPAPHCVATAEPFGFACLHCGEKLPLSLPVAVDSMVKLERRFRSRHCDCQARAPGGSS